MGLAPRSPVEAPLAAAPRVGLLASAIVVPDPPAAPGEPRPRWQGGFAFAPEGCGESGIVDPCMVGVEKDIADNQAVIEVEPFGIWAGDKCSTFDAVRDRQGRARRQLEATQSYQVAQELWTGALTQAETDNNGDPWPNRWLASPESDVLTDGATSSTDALSCLEYALGRCAKGARGMIHATRQMVTHWWALNFLRREGNLILTVNDTIVVPDAGYDGSGPNGEPPAEGSQWAYATGMVYVRLGEVRVVPGLESEATDRLVNTIEYRAERLAAVTWDGCCAFAAELDLSLCDIGGPGS